MYTRITRSGGRSYLQLVESYRTEQGGVRQRVIANLGRLDQLAPKDLDPLINGLNRAVGRTSNEAFAPEYDSAKAFGEGLIDPLKGSVECLLSAPGASALPIP